MQPVGWRRNEEVEAERRVARRSPVKMIICESGGALAFLRLVENARRLGMISPTRKCGVRSPTIRNGVRLPLLKSCVSLICWRE